MPTQSDSRRAAVVESTARHAHDDFQVAWVSAGAGRLYCRGGAHDAPAGSVVVVPPGEMHHGHSVGGEGWSFALFRPEGGALDDVAEETGASPTVGWTVSDAPAVTAAFARLAGSAGAGLGHDALHLEAFATLLAGGEPACAARAAGREPRAVRLAIAFIEAHYAECIRLDELAGVAGLSRFHLVRAFKRQVGLPPHAYQTQLRVAHAMRLLRHGRGISAAAFATGFAAQSHLHHHFKRILGVTPGEYAAAARTLKTPR
jgi:AraC-like DNA-binding protein